MKEIIHINGDLMDSKETIICHQVNCQGRMGSGVALAIKNKFPTAYQNYRLRCTSGSLFLGSCQIVPIPENERNTEALQFVANMAAQDCYGSDGKRYTDYEAFYKCLEKIASFCKDGSISSVAFPHGIGCGLGGGSWDIIYLMIQKVFENTEVQVVIYKK